MYRCPPTAQWFFHPTPSSSGRDARMEVTHEQTP
jgi:hypothetical protein